MKVMLADKSGFCFGVKRAVDESLKVSLKYDKRVYTVGPLIHNNDVVNYLKDKNIYPVELEKIDELKEGDVVIIRSHGIGEGVLADLDSRGLIIVNATCPYVSNIHKKVRKYKDLGYSIIIVGDKNHPEVIGINGWCDNEAIITKEGYDLQNISGKICIVSQTTEKEENFKKVVDKCMKLSDEVLSFNTICSATHQRQDSADKLSKKVDYMVVIGGYNSSNTTKLYEICKKNCINTIHVENSGEIPDNILNLNNRKKIGVTAGASTPDWIIREALLKMSENNNIEMNEQLAYMEQNSKHISVGDLVEGEIISLSDNEAFVNIGYKSDALLPLKEVIRDDVTKLTDIFNVGEIVKGRILSVGSEPILSVIELKREEMNKKRQQAQKELQEIFNEKRTIAVKVKEVVKAGLVSEYKAAKVFIPASHIELYHVNDLTVYVGKELEVNIIEFEEEKRNLRIVGSRRTILKAEKIKKEEAAWNTVTKDSVVEGEVKRIVDFGAFVDINGIDGLLHVSEISWGHITNPKATLKVGEKVKVYILDVDVEKKKLSLSMKKLQQNPWESVEEKYPVGNIVLGKVARFASFGAFVELEPGVDGLVHISQISNERINKPEDVLKVGEEIKAKIFEVDKENKKISLSIKEVEEF